MEINKVMVKRTKKAQLKRNRNRFWKGASKKVIT
jgi:hypothetical protein